MHPILFENSIISLSTLMVLTTIGFIIGINAFFLTLKRKRYQSKILIKNLWTLIIAGLIGGRIGGIIENYGFYEHLAFSRKLIGFLAIWDRQISLISGIIFFFLILIIVLKKEEEEISTLTDFAMTPLMIILFFHSLGSFFDGQLYGRESSLPWAVILQNVNVKYTVPIHPTQLYAAFYTFLIIIFQKISAPKISFFEKKGNLTLVTILMYSTGKFLEIFMRGDDQISIIGIRIDHLISFLFLTGSLYYLINGNEFFKEKLKLFLQKINFKKT